MNGEEGGYNPGHLWKLKKELSPNQRDTPTAMKDINGKLFVSVTNPADLSQTEKNLNEKPPSEEKTGEDNQVNANN